jgi:hypothetical protein
MAQVKCIRDCYVNGFLYRMNRIYDIDPKTTWAKFFDFPPVQEDKNLKLKLDELKKENESLKK